MQKWPNKFLLDSVLDNSPDLNVLDLEMFTGIQSLQYNSALTNIEELVAAKDQAYDDYSYWSINETFITLQKTTEVCDKGDCW